MASEENIDGCELDFAPDAIDDDEVDKLVAGAQPEAEEEEDELNA